MNNFKSRDEAINKKTESAYTLTIGVTWVDGRVAFKHNTKWANSMYGVCHLSRGVFILTPIDYQEPNMITSINASLVENYCERAYSCLNFTCPLNQFSKPVFLSEFGGLGEETLALPNNLGSEPLWFSVGKWANFWRHFIIKGEGGIIKFDESMTNIGD